MTRRNALRGLAGVGCVAVLVTGCTSTAPHAGPAPSAPPSVEGCRALAPTVRPALGDPADRARVTGVLDDFARRAWNPTAPAVRPSHEVGGVYINYRPTFDGVSDPGTQTNVNTDGRSDADAQKDGRHDPLADLAVLRDLDVAAAAGISTPATDRLRCLLQPVTAAEFADYGPPRGIVYTQLAELSQLDPRGPWREEAHRFAVNLSTIFSDPPLLGRTASKSQVRPDWIAESAAALVDAGSRFATPEWTSSGAQLAAQLVAKTADPVTGLFPDTVEVDASGAAKVTAPLARVGAQAQLLDALLTVADHSGDGGLEAAVARTLATMESPQTGLVDARFGGWFFAIDSDGRDVRSGYKETRSAWMVPLLRHATTAGLALPPGAAARAGQLVRDAMYLSASAGYVYRLAPDWTVYRTTAHGASVDENWVSSEATAIAVNVLLGDLQPSS